MRPLEHVRDLARRYPDAWKQLAAFRQAKGKTIDDWPDWCWVPMAGAFACVFPAGLPDIPGARDRARDIAHLAGVGAWRVTQGIYRFDPDLLEALADTPVTGELPVDLLYHLPEYCCFVETPGMRFADSLVGGFFVFLEWDVNRRAPELRFLLDTDKGLTPLIMHLTHSTIEAALRSSFVEGVRQSQRFGLTDPPTIVGREELAAKLLAPFVSVVLYLCSKSAEIDDAKGRGRKPARAVASKKIAAAANAPVVWLCGWRLGAKLRAARQQDRAEGGGSHAAPRPHVRRAHWHTYRTGPGRTGVVLKWLHPILVNAPDESLIVPVIRPID